MASANPSEIVRQDAEVLEQIKKLVEKFDPEDGGDWPDDIYGLCGGNYDDAFNQGVSFGEATLAIQILSIIQGK